MEKVYITQYKAFDGKIFNTLEACEMYELQLAKKEVYNLKAFPIVFPMQDQVTDCTAYLIHSEDEFNMLKRWMDSNFSEVWVDDIDYKGHGWYVLQDDHCGWARVEKLTDIVMDWAKTMERISKHIDSFEEV